MRLLRILWKILAQASGEGAYGRYCDHLRTHHPDLRVPTEREFYLSRLNEKYSRPSRCC
jgi:uncharacterized short protein YbdD (DUF466 family)